MKNKKMNNKMSKIKDIENPSLINEYLFSDIPCKNWVAFYFGKQDPGLSYGERFEKYILIYRQGVE